MTSPRPNADDPTSAMTSTMTYTFPLLTIIWGGIFPSGLILYWIVYTAYLVVQQYLIMGWGNLFPLFGWQPGWAPRRRPGSRLRRARSRDRYRRRVDRKRPARHHTRTLAGRRLAAIRDPRNRPKGSAKRRGRRR